MKARFRFINLSAFARYYIHLDTYQEDITIIELDGVIIKPVLSKGIELASGQRVSVVIKGLDGSVV
jgi:iron transport multicopper oxidase